MDKYHVKLIFTEPLLGTVPKDPDVYSTHIMSKAALTDEQIAEELNSVEHSEEKGWTGFHKTDAGRPFLYDYVIKGFFKDACSMLRRSKEFKSSKLTAHKKVIDGLVFVLPRKIQLDLNGQELGVLERPLRAQTAQGERVALARSDIAPPGTSIDFSLKILGGVSKVLLEEWLDYGELRGLGQWRNAGYGRFDYTLAKAE